MAKNGLLSLSPLLRLHPLVPLSLFLPLLPCPYLHTTRIADRARSFTASLASAANLVKAFGRSRSRSGAAEEEEGERVSGIITLRMQGGPHVLCHDLRSGPWIRGHVHMMSAKFQGFLTPSLPLSKFVQFSITPSPYWTSYCPYRPPHPT